MQNNFSCLPTAIGSFPHPTPESACKCIFDSIPDIPIWPQLPNVDFREKMEIQYTEGMPCIVFEESNQRIYFDTSGDITAQLENFYENYLAENFSYFKISPQFSCGIYELKKQLSKMNLASIKYIKSQIIGPLTFGLSNVDEQKRAIYYNEIFRDVIIKAISIKARWILNEFKPFGKNQIIFVDEPILSAFGSSTYVSLQKQDVIDCLKSVFEPIHQDGALIGTHCCGNTDWTILIDAGVDIINFDAYEYGDTIGYYPEKVKAFLENSGVLAWGIIPTSQKIMDETADSLLSKLMLKMDNLSNKGIDKRMILEQCIITPSCGTGSLSIPLSEKVFSLLSETSKLLLKYKRDLL